MLIAGGVLLVVAVAAFFWARHMQKRLDALSSTETLPCDKLSVDQACEVVGQAQAGPGGVLKAPETGKECVWWRKKITEHWETWNTDSKGNRTKTDHSNTLSDETSSEVFTLKDQAGTVLVTPHGADIDEPVKSYRIRKDQHDESFGQEMLRSLLSNRDDQEIEIEEWILPVGQQLYVRGQPTDSDQGLMMVDPGSHFLISTRSEEELAGSAKLWTTVAKVTAAVAAVAGVGLLIAGALA